MFFTKTVTSSLLALVALPTILAMPAVTGTPTISPHHYNPISLHHYDRAVPSVYTPGVDGGAAVSEAPKSIAPADAPRGPDQVTFTITNHHTAPVYTAHVSAKGFVDVVDGPIPDGVMAQGATAHFAVPTGWAGRLAVVEDKPGRQIHGDESLIEANYVIPDTGDYTVAVFDVDVSYVSVPRSHWMDTKEPVADMSHLI
jgi:hypothetical protein